MINSEFLFTNTKVKKKQSARLEVEWSDMTTYLTNVVSNVAEN